MKPINVKRERGAALLALLAVIMLGASWFLVSQLNAESGGLTAVKRTRNAEVLNRAKQALIGYVAMQAAEAGERNPGRLPCPEGANFIGDNAKEGTSAPTVGAPTCASSIGRLPWRTLGLDKLVDTATEPLWYVVGPTWRLATSTTTLLINSNTSGDITVDGQQVVALIIAPGAAMNVQTSTGCTARNQARSTPSPTMNALDYIECFDPAILPILQFVTTASSTSFNDQVVRITVADIMPAIEAAIANRIEREIVPLLSSVYTPANWVQFFLAATPPLTVSAANPLYPFAAPFSNPTTSNYQGAAGQTMGLLPFNHQTVGCNPATDPRCTTTLIAWPSGTPTTYKASGYGYIQGTPNCSYVGDVAECQGEYHEDDTNVTTLAGTMRIEMSVTLNNVLGGLRTIMVDAAALANKMSVEARDDVALGPWQPQPHTYTYTINTNGSITFTFGASLPNIDSQPPSPPGWGTYAQFRIRFDKSSIFGDHALLNPVDPVPSTNCPATGCTGWFVRNEWYRLLYYAVAAGHTAAPFPIAPTPPSPPSCTTTPPCLSVTNVMPAGAQRAILILAGRSINGSLRPSGTPADYLESGNATGAFTSKTISASAAIPVAQRFNDRIVVIDSN